KKTILKREQKRRNGITKNNLTINELRHTTKLLYASRGIHSILGVLFYPLLCVQADKVTAGLKATGQAHIAGTLCFMLRKTVQQKPTHIWHICKPKPTS
ncbi:hypothetical protein, partial [Marinilabilia salmonicolor]|uniref:hypothetical protein n=1 Tax=Marinilabilia salmonicolor TaxID=989 RepID=UPI001C62DFBB